MFYLGGGGSHKDEANVWDPAFKGAEQVVIWPWAQKADEWQPLEKKLQATLTEMGVKCAVTVAREPDFGLTTADVIFIAGGSSFELLAFLRQHNLIERLRIFIESGRKAMGGSAGAMILSSDIGIINKALGGMDEDTVGLEDGDTGALALYGHWTVYPHYEERTWGGHCRRWAREKGITVLALPENCGLVGDEKRRTLMNAGPADVLVLLPDGTEVLRKQGETWSMDGKTVVTER